MEDSKKTGAGDSGVAVPFSAGTQAPVLRAPPKMCDSHMHIFDPRFPPSSHWTRIPSNSPVEAYRQLQKRLGIARVVVVNPSTYGINNDCTVDAIRQLGRSARGVAVVGTEVTDAELNRLDSAGVTGIRVNFVSPQSWGITTVEMLNNLAARVERLGWHVQIFATGDQLVGLESALAKLPNQIVIDHLGRLPMPAGVGHPAFEVMRRLLDKGKTWVKLSGAYMDTKVGPPGYADMHEVGRALVQAAPERMVWGTDWPHPIIEVTPDDAALLDLMLAWAPDESVRNKILVDNPARLYGFDEQD